MSPDIENPPVGQTEGQEPLTTTTTTLTAADLSTAEKIQLIKLQTAERQRRGGFDNTTPAQREGIKDKALRRIHADREKANDTGVHRGQALIAYALAADYKDKLLYVHGIGWHYYDDTSWQEDKTGRAVRAVLAVLRKKLADSLNNPDLRQDVRKCESANGIEGVLKIARALPELAATPDQLDANPYLFNVRNGTLDLHTMQLRPHDPADRITRCAAAAWDPSAAGPVWEACLSRWLPDPEVRGFLQRFAGLALAGKVLEHILAIYTGKGRNGKSVFNQAYSSALGDYAITAEPDLFLHREGAHPTGTMDLRGCRYAAVSESDKDRPLAEATVKQLTGGDTIKARRLYQDFTEFPPSHTAVLITNHLPKVRGDDPALWARLRVVPFDVVIPAEEQDTHLPEKLELELDAILAWAVTGWQDYQQHGLAAPAAVLAATDDYHREADALGRFISEECDTGPGYSALTESLHHKWLEWAAAEGLGPMSKRAFGIALESRGYEARKGTGGVRVRAGIQLKTPSGLMPFGGRDGS
jgi:putative DNA primase/helicase